MTLTLTSPAFTHGASIPAVYTCEGSDISPELRWTGAPPNTVSFALIVDDPDAPDPAAPKTTWVHWVLFDIPATAHALPQAVTSAQLPPGTHEGLNDWKRPGWGGPCPPVGRHRYFFKLYALDRKLGLDHATKAKVEAAMKGHILASAELVATYQKTK